MAKLSMKKRIELRDATFKMPEKCCQKCKCYMEFQDGICLIKYGLEFNMARVHPYGTCDAWEAKQ